MLAQLLINGIVAGSIYALIALGFSLIFQTTRFFHFAHGAVYTWGAYLVYFFMGLRFPMILAVTLAVAIGALLGVSCEVLVYHPLRRRGATSLTLLVASLGLLFAAQNVISLCFGDDLKSIRSGVVHEGLPVIGARITTSQIAILFAGILLYLSVCLFMYRSRVGLLIRAVADDPELATILGADSRRLIVLVFAIGSALAAGAAILISLDTDLTPSMGFTALLMGVVAAIVGGIGSVPGAALGGMFVGLVQHLGVWKLPTQWQDTIVFSVLFFFLLFRPQGFLGRLSREEVV